MLLSSLSMSSCFFIGSLTEMPAVRMFALYAGVALVINFFLQMTAFLAIFTLDTRRQQDNRLDVFCCVRAKRNKRTNAREGFLYTFFRDIYTPFLMKDTTRIAVLIVFAGWLCSSIAVLDKIHVGLEQVMTCRRPICINWRTFVFLSHAYVADRFESFARHMPVC